MENCFRRRSRVLIAAGFILLVTQTALFANNGGVRSPRVLIVHSYSTDFLWTRDFDNAIRESVLSATENTAIIESEFLGMKRHNSPMYFDAAARFFAAKYAGIEFDLIFVTDNLGLSFMRKYRDSVFGPVATVFAGINDFQPELIAGMEKITGVAEDLSILETVAFALGAMSGQTVFILGDGTVTADRNVHLIRQALDQLGWVGGVQRLDPLYIRDLGNFSSTIGEDDIVFLAGLIRDEHGTIVDTVQAGNLISQASPAPVFSFWDFLIGTGVVGGKLASGTAQGEAAATIGIEILQGTPPEDLPILRESPNRWIFDMQAIPERFRSQWPIPRDALRLNTEISLWRSFRGEILFTIVVFSILVILISLLIFNIQTRSVASKNLQESLEEKEVLLKEIHHRVKNNLQVVSSILYMQSEMIADPTAYAYFKDCETRVHSMALVHEQLYQSSSLSRIAMKTYVAELTSNLISAMKSKNATIQIVESIEEIHLDLDHAIPIGLIINELVSNALKYAYPKETGVIEVEMRIVEENCVLTVRDYGVGMGKISQTTNSLGTQLVHALASQLNGNVTFRNTEPGLEVVVSIEVIAVEV